MMVVNNEGCGRSNIIFNKQKNRLTPTTIIYSIQGEENKKEEDSSQQARRTEIILMITSKYLLHIFTV